MRNVYLSVLLIFSLSIFAQTESTVTDTTNVKEKHKTKTGFTFGALPAIAYDTDIGFKYGAVANIYYFGDGSTYPKYLHSLYLEWSRTTKGSGINQIVYDTEHLIPKVRLTLEASYFTEKAVDFFGFNGYSASYRPSFEDDVSGNDDYVTRMYYKHEREQLVLRADFQREILGKKLRALFGYSHYNTSVATVNIGKLNEGKDESEMLPDTLTLYDKYVNWGVINQDEKNGGQNGMFRLGLVYDTRDQEGNAMKGMWSEALLMYSPSLTGKGSSYAKLALTHRQYFTLRKEVLNFAYRVSYQPKIAGDIPFYMLPFVYNSMRNRDGLGGARTLRGILRNRVVGDDILYANLELRWKFYRGIVMNQNLYLALHPFVDGGMITGKYDFEKSGIPQSELSNITTESEELHASYGAGLAVVMNHNFILNISYGRAVSKKDGDSGLYIILNYLF